MLFGMVLLQPVTVQAEQQGKPDKDNAPKFELLDGDRVLFLGNTLIEREQKYGYWETMLTARYPDRNIIFRNLGWDGDTVWADSRGLFDPPAKGYQRMLEHVGRIKPTVIFLGYGNNEAFAGKKGLPAFIKQYNTLIDDLKKVSAKKVRFVILSPIRNENLGPPLPDPKEINLKTKDYVMAISTLAERRQFQFVDLFSTVVPDLPPARGYLGYIDLGSIDLYLTRDGTHLRHRGYKYSAKVIYSQLGLTTYTNLELNADGTVKEAKGLKVENVKSTKKGLSFS
ncbi:MAG: SGNH/GDSL hydrolase family protein, partial [Planctomycetes bacterium]|nr:SGNH/GDSL hydrolase family protein [Planctomycetota bacterium]